MRLTKPAEFAAVFKSGRRAGTRHLAVHLLVSDSGLSGVAGPAISGTIQAGSTLHGQPARAGFVVSSKVGNSVVRHRVTRRLREQVRPLLADLAPGTHLVVRALPPAAAAASADLAGDLRQALKRLQPR
jgi:ribonuclease P protein component